MIYLDQAILNRYNAAGLNVSIGQIYDEQQPEHSVMPYVSYENASDTRVTGTQSGNVYKRAQITFTVWHTQKLLCGLACELIRTTFQNSNKAATNPLAMLDVGGIVYIRNDSPYVIKQISDTIWSGVQTFSVMYRVSSNPVPA